MKYLTNLGDSMEEEPFFQHYNIDEQEALFPTIFPVNGLIQTNSHHVIGSSLDPSLFEQKVISSNHQMTVLQQCINELSFLIQQCERDEMTTEEGPRIKNLAEKIIIDIRKVFKELLVSKKRTRESRRIKNTNPECLNCGATTTPEWRRGPQGPRTYEGFSLF
eukprot:TRINITY_DN1276_c0_g1_i1.p1 TRINITY_DN1276_c0_g1~~TRINITY_DN1276_c0_g1_i1.p1  ORF type:complete len:163 (-),score=13.28 TRINITY_DN1276_c0_g1_i1:490-978(-)